MAGLVPGMTVCLSLSAHFAILMHDAAHALLLTKGYGARIEIQPGYAAVLRMATSKAA